MQTSGLYASASPHPLYHPPYHPILHPGPQDHELKRRYLSLLPPQQIIDICLNFDLHVPPYVKSTIWPPDINAAIAAIQKISSPATPAASSLTSNGEKLVTSSSTEPSHPSSTTEKSIEQPAEAQPPDKPPSPRPENSTAAQTAAQTSTQSSATSTEQTAPTPTTAASSTASVSPQQPPYPHQPYGYGHPQAAYPHAPYYQTPPGYPPYPSPYPYAMPGHYPQPHTTYPQPTAVPYAPPHSHVPPQPHDVFHSNSADDLPSYEEMIAEALADSTDSEGCAPKDLFTWMAARYPLQQNFRPSASQALQKAFKRGRFLKSSNGKYKLNTTWEGGTTARRITRRPQTQNPSSASPAPASPFTHAPLHHNQPSQTPAFQTQPFGYPYQQQSAQSFSGFTQNVQPGQTQVTAVAPTPATTAATTAPPTTSDPSQATSSVQDAWEAAQNILKAINFDTLLSLPSEESENPEAIRPPPGLNTVVLPSASTSAPSAPDVPPSTADGPAPAVIVTGAEDHSAGRAELQAHLALLAAQLAELSWEDEVDPAVHYPLVASLAAPPPPAASPVVAADPITTSLVPPSMSTFPPVPLPQSQQLQQLLPYNMPMYEPRAAQQSVLPTLSPTALPPPRPLEAMPVEEEEEDSEDDDDDMEAVI